MKTLATLALAGLFLSSCVSKKNDNYVERKIIGIDSTNVYLISATEYKCLYDTIVSYTNILEKTSKIDTISQIVSDSIVDNFMTTKNKFTMVGEITLDPKTKTYTVDEVY